MIDNLTVSADGTILVQEDVGNNPRSSKLWHYDPTADTLTEIARHDPARFGDETGASPAAPFTQNEESSGVLDVTGLFPHAPGERVYLLDTMAHYPFSAEGSLDRQEIVEGGQLMLMRVGDDAPGTGSTGSTPDGWHLPA